MYNAVAVATERPIRPLDLIYGRVTGRVDDLFRVETEGEHGGERAAWARKADGCLLEPSTDDLVLLAGGSADQAFILSVLIKSGVESRIDLPGRAEVHADGITLSARETVSLQAPQVEMAGINGSASFLDLRLQADSCRGEVHKASLIVRFFDSVMDRVTQRVKNCFRRVEDTEKVTAGRISTLVRQRYSLKAKHASLLAEEEVSVDGKRIHLG